MLGSNQRPLPCEGSNTMSWLFAVVQKMLQISIFSLTSCRGCSLLFTWVAARLLHTGGSKLSHKQLWIVRCEAQAVDQGPAGLRRLRLAGWSPQRVQRHADEIGPARRKGGKKRRITQDGASFVDTRGGDGECRATMLVWLSNFRRAWWADTSSGWRTTSVSSTWAA